MKETVVGETEPSVASELETGTVTGPLGAASSATLTVTRPPDSEVPSAVPAVVIRNELLGDPVDASGASVEGPSEHPTTPSSAERAQAAAVSATHGAEREVHSGWGDLGAHMMK
ncbi:hypothetical protein [Sorangium cellulosum]|uniref:hypothetical protein n=1 Tax=Sorangium cellulosum TaxID=56 RepID=UPI001A913778|nr:hypothetical protein [Sorangium cellulosum]